MSEGEEKKWLKEELGRGICPQGNFFQPAMSQHSHCMVAAVLTTGTALMTRGPQHMQWLPSTGRQQRDSARGKAQRWRHQDAKTDGRLCTQQSCGDLPARWQWSGGNWRHPSGVSAGVHDVLAPATGLILTWNFLVVIAFEMDGSNPWHFGKNMTIFSRYLERCGWKYEWCLKHLTLSWNKEQLRLMYKQLSLRYTDVWETPR